MHPRIRAVALAGVASMAGLGGAAALSGAAEAHGRHHHVRPGFSIILKDRYAYDYGFHRMNGCGWLFDRWQETGSLKWYKRWHMCRYGW